MAIKAGTLASGTLQKDTDKNAYTCLAPAGSAAFSINFCNNNAGPARVSLMWGNAGTMNGTGNVGIVRNLEIPGEDSWERTGLAVGVGMSVWMRSDQGNVDYSIYGWEKA